MKHLLILALVLATPFVYADSELYFKVGAGYKFDQQDKVQLDGVTYKLTTISPYSARFELGVETGNLTYGISHHSNWDTGWPFNDIQEQYKTEIFIDYKWSWSF